MKKENIISVVVYLLVFAVAIVYGFTVLQTHFTYSSIEQVWMYAIYIIVSVLGGVFATGLLQEFGHFLGARVGGYKITFWSLFYFTFYREKEKMKFGFKNFDGLTGETRIIPNYEKKENPNPYPFILYGTIFNVAWVVACAFMFFSYKNGTALESDIAYFFLTMGVIALLATVYNIVPVKFDAPTDGYRLSQIKGDVASFNELLLAESGESIAPVEGEKEEAKVNKPTKFIPEVALNDVYSLLAEKKYDEAIELLNKIFENEKTLSTRVALDAKAQLIYAYIFSKDKKEYEEYYEKEVPFSLRRELSNETSFSIIRTYILTAGLLDGSLSEVLLSLKKAAKSYKNVPANRKHIEATLYNEALDKVIEAHPKWEEVPNYRLYE